MLSTIHILWRSSCSECKYAMNTEWELCSLMSIELHIVDNSACVVHVYIGAVTAAGWSGFLNFVLSKALHKAEALELREAVKPCGAFMYIPSLTCYLT